MCTYVLSLTHIGAGAEIRLSSKFMCNIVRFNNWKRFDPPTSQLLPIADIYTHIYKQRERGFPLRLPFDGRVYFFRFLRHLLAQIKTRPSTVGAQIIDDKHASPPRCGGGEGARSSKSSDDDDDDDAAGLVLFYKRLSAESRYCINVRRFPVKGTSREHGVCLRARRVNFRRHH